MHTPNQPYVTKPRTPGFTVRSVNLDRETSCIEGETIMQSARRSGIRIAGACGGRGVCGACMVRIEQPEHALWKRPTPRSERIMLDTELIGFICEDRDAIQLRWRAELDG